MRKCFVSLSKWFVVFGWNRCFKGWFSTWVKLWKISDLTRIVLPIAEWEINGTKWNWKSWSHCIHFLKYGCEFKTRILLEFKCVHLFRYIELWSVLFKSVCLISLFKHLVQCEQRGFVTLLCKDDIGLSNILCLYEAFPTKTKFSLQLIKSDGTNYSGVSQ